MVIVNDNLAHYRGEVEVILKDIPNDGERNLAGRIPEEEFLILDRMEEKPDPADVAGYEKFMERYTEGLAIERAAVDHLLQ